MLLFAAATDTAGGGGFAGLFTALGLNLQTFLLNGAAFLLVAWILGKYVFPSLMKALDGKQGELEAAVRLETEAKKSLEKAEDQAGKIVTEARGAADEILAAARDQATVQLDEARAKSEAQAQRTISEAREQLARDVTAARQTLRGDTARLVASAAEAVLGEKLDAKHDAELIGRSLETK